MTTHNQRLGKWGEETAADFLINKGYTIIQRNARTPYGEIDLVARDSDCTVFVEVKTRANRKHGLPEDAITPKKQENLINTALTLIQENPAWDGNWRIDVIAIQKGGRPTPEIVHFENAVTG